MSLIPIITDWREGPLAAAPGATSLLLTPLGGRTLLGCLADELDRARVRDLTIVANFWVDDEYVAACRSICAAARVTSVNETREILSAAEPSDWLLFIDPRRHPLHGLGIGDWVEGLATCRASKHLIRLQRNVGGTAERVVCADGEVHAIQRLYDGVTGLRAVDVVCSLLPGDAARSLSNWDCLDLSALRATLATHGIPVQDVEVRGPVLDLTRERGILDLAERFLTVNGNGHNGQLAGLAEQVPGVRISTSARIAPSSRIYGPAVILDEATIGAQAIVVGPVTIGARANVGERAFVTQSVVLPDVVVPDGSVVRGRVFAGENGHASVVGSNGDTARDGGRDSWDAVARGLPAMGDSTIERAPRRTYLTVKRATDIVVALGALILLAPVLAVVAALVKLTSSGPVLFAHTREGLGGRVFRCWKFRTMVDGAHSQQRALYRQNSVDGPQFKLADDPRVTRLGQWLRTTNLDELPQLINVLLGHMSLIGPRPSPFRENQICVPWRDARLSARPGITGLWQICRHDRTIGDFHQWIYYDILYARHVSLALDVKIFLATIVTLGGRWSVPLTWLIRPGRAAAKRTRRVRFWERGRARTRRAAADVGSSGGNRRAREGIPAAAAPTSFDIGY